MLTIFIIIPQHYPQPDFVDTNKFRFKREVTWGAAYIDHVHRQPVYVDDKNPDNLFYDKVRAARS